MLVGVDFDNTIVCYDSLFHRVAVEQGLIPAELPPSKGHIRDYLRTRGQEDAWTEMQGYVYGSRMREAPLFPGVGDFFVACKASGIPLRIISHKTRHPYQGPAYDLHQAAQDWLEFQGFYDANRFGLERGHVFFELTKEAKLARIGRAGCTHFIDDLPELLAAPEFPAGVRRILFDPSGQQAGDPGLARVTSWGEMPGLIRP